MAEPDCITNTLSTLVVRLPTAAKRKVRYPQTRAERDAVELHRQMHPKLQFPRKRSHYAWLPTMRRALEQAKLIDNCARTPDFALALAVFLSLDEQSKRKAEMYLELMSLKDGEDRGAASALAWVRFEGSDRETKADIVQALKHYRNGDVE